MEVVILAGSLEIEALWIYCPEASADKDKYIFIFFNNLTYNMNKHICHICMDLWERFYLKS